MRVLVTKPDGTQVEVHLDQGFRFLGTETVDNDGQRPHATAAIGCDRVANSCPTSRRGQRNEPVRAVE